MIVGATIVEPGGTDLSERLIEVLRLGGHQYI